MSFETDLVARQNASTGEKIEYKKTRWLFPRPGKYQIRVLDTGYVSKYTHWIKSGLRASVVECLGPEECPICIDNSKIIAENPDNFRDVAGFIPYTVTCYVNVFDKTLVKTDPVSGEENNAGPDGQFALTSWGSKESIVNIEPAPSNKVKVFSRGKTVFDTIADYDVTIQETTGMNITEYDLTLVVRPRDGTIGSNLSIVPQPHLKALLVLPEGEERFDLSKVTIKLQPDEIREFQRGVSLKDIFASRREMVKVETEDAFAEGSIVNKPVEVAEPVLQPVEPVQAEVTQPVEADKLSDQAEDFLKKFESR